jgi:hypothetical protein
MLSGFAGTVRGPRRDVTGRMKADVLSLEELSTEEMAARLNISADEVSRRERAGDLFSNGAIDTFTPGLATDGLRAVSVSWPPGRCRGADPRPSS